MIERVANEIEAFEMILDEIVNPDPFEYARQLFELEIAISPLKVLAQENPPIKDPSKQSLHIGDSV